MLRRGAICSWAGLLTRTGGACAAYPFLEGSQGWFGLLEMVPRSNIQILLHVLALCRQREVMEVILAKGQGLLPTQKQVNVSLLWPDGIGASQSNVHTLLGQQPSQRKAEPSQEQGPSRV